MVSMVGLRCHVGSRSAGTVSRLPGTYGLIQSGASAPDGHNHRPPGPPLTGLNPAPETADTASGERETQRWHAGFLVSCLFMYIVFRRAAQAPTGYSKRYPRRRWGWYVLPSPTQGVTPSLADRDRLPVRAWRVPAQSVVRPLRDYQPELPEGAAPAMPSGCRMGRQWPGLGQVCAPCGA